MKTEFPWRTGLMITGIFLTAGLWAQESETYFLQYGFIQSQNLQYKTERVDSIKSGSGDQMMEMNHTNWTLQTLSVEQTPPNNPYRLMVKIDSTWSDSDMDGQRRRMGAPPVKTYEMDASGYADSDNPPTEPFLVPLPKIPVSVNATWEFKKKVVQKGRRQGETTITGQCLLHSVTEYQGKQTAVILINYDVDGSGEFKMRNQQGEISGTFSRKGAGTSLIYFDINEGRVFEVVTEEKTDSVTESTVFSREMEMKSNYTVKLL